MSQAAENRALAMLRKGPVGLSNRFWEAMNIAPARTLRKLERDGFVTISHGADCLFATLVPQLDPGVATRLPPSLRV
jgi:hypothetical protein